MFLVVNSETELQIHYLQVKKHENHYKLNKDFAFLINQKKTKKQ